jgi:hypothetical protein
MAIDRIYLVCTKKDFYFARVALASIRYWNESIPISLIKDQTYGHFDTHELEKILKVTIAESSVKNMGYYAKLLPFIEGSSSQRIFIMDADCCWCGDICELLKTETADFIADGYDPENLSAEMERWYFMQPLFNQKFQNYRYPGFLFNVGHFVCNPSIFSLRDFTDLLVWKEYPEPAHPDCFFHEQGMLNFLIAEKLKKSSITYRNVHFHRWGWDAELKSISVSQLKQHQPYPFLIHWYGKKNGLLSTLPCSRILKLYEDYYYSLVSNGYLKKQISRMSRTASNFPAWIYESAKTCYYFLFKRKP